MKVLLAAPSDGATGKWIEKAFIKKSWQVIPFDYRAQGIHQGQIGMNQSLVKVAVQDKVDLVLVLKGEVVWPETYKRLKRFEIPTVVWNFDPRDGKTHWVNKTAASCDVFFTIAKGLVPYYETLGANSHWLLEAADPEVHRPYPIEPHEPVYSVGFVGTIKDVPGREEWLLRVQNGLKDQLHTWGSFPGALAGRNHHGRAEEHVGLPGDQGLSWVVSHTQVSLGRDRNPEIERSYGARIFRTLAAGGFLVTNATLGVREDFSPYVAVYESTEECLEMVHHYLLNGAERRVKAALGRKFVLANHTWSHRVDELLKQVGL